MKNNKPLIITLLVLFLGAATWVGFTLFQSKKVEDVFLLVPAEASLVVEISDVKNFHSKTFDKNMFKGLVDIVTMKDWMARFDALVPLLDSSAFSNALPQGQSIYCSVHASVARELGLVWYIPFESESWKSEVIKYLKNKISTSEYVFETRNYEGYEVYELVEKASQKTFTFVWYENVLVGSYTGYLVEDVIRLIRTQNENHFMAAFEQQRESRKIHYDDGNVFVNFSTLPQFVGYFASDTTTQLLKGIASFAEIGVYDITVDSTKWLFHGYTYHKLGATNYSSIFDGQTPQTFSLNEYIPMNTSICYFWGVDKPKEWYRKWMQYNEQSNKEYLAKLKDWEGQNRLALEHEFLSIVGSEMAMLTFPSVSSSALTEKALVLKIKNKEQAIASIDEWRVRNKSVQKEMYSEYYDGHKIHQWSVGQLPYWLCGDMAKGFNEVYYTFVQDVLVLGSSVNAVKNIVKSYNNQDVWRRNVDMVSRWKDLTASNFSVFIQPQMLKSAMLQGGLSPAYTSALQQYDQQYNLLKSIVIQFAFTQDKLYTNAIVEHNFSKIVRNEVATFAPSATGSKGLMNANLEVVSVSDNWTDVFYTDSTHVLSLLNNKGDFAWSFNTGTALQTKISSGDFDKDGSSDYVFISENKIHAITNKGLEIKGFPIELGDTLKPDHLVVMDYDLSKKYRFAVSDVYGKVYLFDMNGTSLEGWKGLDLKAKLYTPATHIRIGANDRIIAWNAKGDLYCINRRAQIQSGFPVSTGQPSVSSVFLQKGTRLSDSYVYTVSDKGLKCKMNLDGKLELKTELPRAYPTGKFKIVDMINSTRKYYMVNWDQHGLQLLNEEDQVLFTVEGVFSNDLLVSSVVQGTTSLFLIHDKQTGVNQVYNEKGKLLHNVSGAGNNLVMLTRKDLSGNSVYLLELNTGRLRWFKLDKEME